MGPQFSIKLVVSPDWSFNFSYDYNKILYGFLVKDLKVVFMEVSREMKRV